METNNRTRETADFLAQYVALLMGSGVHTSRIVRNSKRIAESFDSKLTVSVFNKSAIITLTDKQTGESVVEVVEIPSLSINFAYNSELSALSWEAFDTRLPLAELKDKFEAVVATKTIDRKIVMLMAGVANGSFCQLFGGDWLSTIIVFVATVIGFSMKTVMQTRAVNHYILFVVSAFISSVCSATALFFDTTSEIAITTSVLFLIPGVPLINGVIDIVEGYVLSGFARLIKATMLVVCIAIGLSFTLWLVKSNLI